MKFDPPTSTRAPYAALATGLALAASSAPVLAGDGDWRLRIGPGRIAFNEAVRLHVGGAVVPGAGARLSDDTALLAEIGYRFTPHCSAGLTLGIPPTTEITGTGTAAPLGPLGRVKYGPIGLSGQYQFNTGGVLQPYVGAGVVRYLIMDERGGAVAPLQVDNAWGSLLQVGVDLRLSDGLGLFLDVKKLFVDTEAAGTLPALGGAPVRADVRLDPLVIHTGLLLRF